MREYSICIDIFALLYSKLSNGADMVNKNIINEYYEEFQKRANEMGKTIFFEITKTVHLFSKIYRGILSKKMSFCPV